MSCSKTLVSCNQLFRDKEEGTLGYMCRTPYPGGAPANVAAALGRLGVKVAFVSALGQDDLARQMLSLLKGTCLPSKVTGSTTVSHPAAVPSDAWQLCES